MCYKIFHTRGWWISVFFKCNLTGISFFLNASIPAENWPSPATTFVCFRQIQPVQLKAGHDEPEQQTQQQNKKKSAAYLAFFLCSRRKKAILHWQIIIICDI